jgi:sec-independent protein translocase protein TatB
VLDIGMPEFLVIAVVALVVLGPERLPEVMRRAGLFYRQAREMLQQYTSEAQRMFDEGMREVEDVSATINSAWQDATTESADANQPPPRLRQLPPPLQPPATAADAGPWTLPAWQRDAAADREPRPEILAASPFVLEREAPPESKLDGYTGIGYGGTPLLEAAPPEADMPDLDPLAAGAPEPDLPPIPQIPARPPLSPLEGLPPEVAPAPVGANGVTAEPAHANGATPTTPAAAPVPSPSVPATAQPTGPGDAVRQMTVIELYLQGELSWQKAAEFLNLSPEAFLDRVEQVRRSRPVRGL